MRKGIFVKLPFLVILLRFSYQRCGSLYLSVSASQQTLQINWNFDCPHKPDTIVLYELKTNSSKKLQEYSIPNDATRGHLDTTIKFRPSSNFPCNWNVDNSEQTCHKNCMQYFLRAYKTSQLINWGCYSIYPDWMKNFGEMKLSEMLIPGAFMAATTSTHPAEFKDFFCYQNHQFWKNLVSGIRYFDIEVGNHGTFDKEFYIYSNKKAPCQPLIPNLMAVEKFLEKSPKEVVIIDMRHFTHFSAKTHEKLINLINQIFGDMLLSPSEKGGADQKLSDLWSSNKRLIINYRDEAARQKHPDLWDDIKYINGNKTWASPLKNYICNTKNVERDKKKKLTAVILGVTPYWEQLEKHNMKERSDWVNQELMGWLIDCKILHLLNLAATSYVDSNNLVAYAIAENKRRQKSG